MVICPWDIDINSTLTWMISCVFPQTGGVSWCIPGDTSGKPCWSPSHTSDRRRKRSPARERPARIWSIQEVERRWLRPSTRSSVSTRQNFESSGGYGILDPHRGFLHSNIFPSKVWSRENSFITTLPREQDTILKRKYWQDRNFTTRKKTKRQSLKVKFNKVKVKTVKAIVGIPLPTTTLT